MIKNNLKCGFTLIELLVVILIIGILAAIALPKYNKAVEKSKYTETEELLQSIYGAQQRYHLIQNKYAESFDGLDITFPGTMEDDGISFITKNYKFSLEEISRGFVKAYRKRGDNSIYAIYKNLTNNKLYCEDLDTTDSITCNTFFGYTCWDFSQSPNGSASGCPPTNCNGQFAPPSRPGGSAGCAPRYFY